MKYGIDFIGAKRVTKRVGISDIARHQGPLVYLDKKQMGNVVAQELKAFMLEQVLNGVPRSGEKIVHAQHLAHKLQQSFGER